MGSFTLPPGWSTTPPSAAPPVAGGGFTLPPGWSTSPPTTIPPEPPGPLGSGSLSERWAAAAPRRDAALGGITKSLLSTLVGVYDLPGQVADFVSPPQRSLTDLMLDRQPRRRMTAREALAADPSNPSAPNITPTEAEQPIYTGANIAQFLAPTPAGKGPAATYALEAGLSALLTGLQGGTAEETAQAGVVSGAARPLLGLLGRGVVAAVGKAGDKGKALQQFLAERMKESALHGYKEVLKPATRENKAITQRIAPEMIDRGVTGLTRERMLADAAKKVERFGGEVDAAIDALPKEAVIRTRPILDHMAEAKAAFKTGEETVTRQVPSGVLDQTGKPIMREVSEQVPIYADAKAVRTIDGLAKIVARHGDSMTPDQIIKLRRIFDDQIAQAKGFHGKTLREGSEIEAKRELAGAIRGELAKQFPDLAKVNREFSFWSNVEKVLGETVERTASQSKPLGETVVKGALAGGAVAGGAEMVVPAATAGLLWRATQSTAWRTHSAVYKTKVANALSSGNWDEVARLLNQVAAGGVGAAKP